jgi:glycosyltransferase involved in cell wall biosynthesis
MAHFLPSVLDSVDSIADEIVVVDGHSTDATVDLLKSYPKVRLFRRQFTGNFGEQKNYAIEQASGDWVLVVDSDEVLGDKLVKEIPKAIQTTRYSHFKICRYWLVESNPWRYVHGPHHYPDYQLRLFRNLPQFRYDPGKIVHTHFPREGRGPGKKLKGLHIFHFDFMLKDRAAREEKVRRYVRLEPWSQSTSEMYLFEDGDYKVKVCREPLKVDPFGKDVARVVGA